MSTPKRHHYLPIFYLEKFSKNNILSVFDRELNAYRERPPISTAVKKHYYTIKDDEGNKNVEIEKFLSQIEGDAKPIIAKLEKNENISEEDKERLSVFISFLINRVPDFEKSTNKFVEKIVEMTGNMMFCDEKRTKSVIDQYEQETGKKMDISPEELFEFHKDGDFKYIIHRNFSLEMMRNTSLEIAHYFKQMNWILFHAPHITSFITTDNPFALIPPDNHKNSIYGTGIATPGAKKIVPLTQSLCLMMLDHGTLTKHKDIDRKLVKEINIKIAWFADRFVIGRDEALVKRIVKTIKLDQWKYPGRVRVD